MWKKLKNQSFRNKLKVENGKCVLILEETERVKRNLSIFIFEQLYKLSNFGQQRATFNNKLVLNDSNQTENWFKN